MQWGSSHEVCGKLTLICDLPQSASLMECGFQATPTAALHGLLPPGVLGASPDGLVWECEASGFTANAVEIKCPFPFQDNHSHGYRSNLQDKRVTVTADAKRMLKQWYQQFVSKRKEPKSSDFWVLDKYNDLLSPTKAGCIQACSKRRQVQSINGDVRGNV
eukprot:516459-Pelagomonas_calceolata.AAC.1